MTREELERERRALCESLERDEIYAGVVHGRERDWALAMIDAKRRVLQELTDAIDGPVESLTDEELLEALGV